VERFQRAPITQPVLLNVNVPNVEYAELAGLETYAAGQAPQGRAGRETADAARRHRLLDRSSGRRAGRRARHRFLRGGAARVSITPLQVDLTFPGQLALVKDWLAR
jgi:5'-nucleotidase